MENISILTVQQCINRAMTHRFLTPYLSFCYLKRVKNLDPVLVRGIRTFDEKARQAHIWVKLGNKVSDPSTILTIFSQKPEKQQKLKDLFSLCENASWEETKISNNERKIRKELEQLWRKFRTNENLFFKSIMRNSKKFSDCAISMEIPVEID